MQRKAPLKEILASTRAQWDQPDSRSSVRSNFDKVLKCRTEALGSDVYASSSEQKVFHHTCKSRACPSCGHRATILWQREMWAALPDIEYIGVVFTMPDVLWPILRSNRHLLNDLPALGGAVIDQWSRETYGVRRMIMVVRHTFGRHLNFNPHLHVLVSVGGLRPGDGTWIPGCPLDKEALMKRWRYAPDHLFEDSAQTGAAAITSHSKRDAEAADHAVRALVERRCPAAHVEGPLSPIRGPIRPSAAARPVSNPDEYRRRNQLPNQGPQTKTRGSDPIFSRGLPQPVSRSSPRPLSARDQALRPSCSTHQMAYIRSTFCPVGTATPPQTATPQLGEVDRAGIWSESVA
jgi:hypothetical protein